jgi:DNA-binding protein YbaB
MVLGRTTVAEADRDANHALRARFDDVYDQYQRLRSGMDDLQQRLATMQVSAESPDGLVRATVGPRGQLIDLRLDQRVYRDLDVDQLARAVVSTTQAAVEEATAQVEELMSGYLPADSGSVQDLRDNDFGSLLRRQDAVMRETTEGDD